MRAYFLFLILLVSLWTARTTEVFDRDDCPMGCMNGSDALMLRARVGRCEREAHNLRQMIKRGGGSGDISPGGNTEAKNVLQAILTHADAMAHAKRCSNCIHDVCDRAAIAAFFKPDTEVILYEGTNVKACKGCECAFREIVSHIREHRRTQTDRLLRTPLVDTPFVAMVTDHSLAPGEKKPKEHASARHVTPRLDGECAPDPDQITQSIKEADIGFGTSRYYIVDMDNDSKIGRLTLFVYHHHKQ